MEEDGAVGQGRDTSDVDCTTHIQLLLTGFFYYFVIILVLAFFPSKKISCINKCSKFVVASGVLSWLSAGSCDGGSPEVQKKPVSLIFKGYFWE